MPGGLPSLPHLWHNMCQQTSALVCCLASDFLCGWSPPLTQFLFLMRALIFCFTLFAPFSGCWALIHRLPHILGDPVYVTILLFALLDSFPPFSTLFSPSLLHTDPYEPTNPCLLAPAGFGQWGSPGRRFQGVA